MSTFLSLLFIVVILALIVYVVDWGIGKIGIGEPFNKIIYALLVLFVIVVLVGMLMGGVPLARF